MSDVMMRFGKPFFNKGFTLVELFAVIGIVALLIAALLPVLEGARKGARASHCLSNLRQIGIATTGYQGSHGGYFPPAFASPDGGIRWFSQLLPYLNLPGYPDPADGSVAEVSLIYTDPVNLPDIIDDSVFSCLAAPQSATPVADVFEAWRRVTYIDNLLLIGNVFPDTNTPMIQVDRVETDSESFYLADSRVADPDGGSSFSTAPTYPWDTRGAPQDIRIGSRLGPAVDYRHQDSTHVLYASFHVEPFKYHITGSGYGIESGDGPRGWDEKFWHAFDYPAPPR